MESLKIELTKDELALLRSSLALTLETYYAIPARTIAKKFKKSGVSVNKEMILKGYRQIDDKLKKYE